jgi:RHS repeat-associated protein
LFNAIFRGKRLTLLSGRLTQISQTIGGGEKAFNLTYDSLGRRTALETPLYRSKGKWKYLSTSYAYDAAGRLTSITHDNPAGTIDTLAYGYDPNGNRISITGAGVQPQRAEVTDTLYDEANEALQFNAADMANDENGNLLSRTDACGATTYEWDARDRLVGITGFRPDCSPLAASFAYDPLGRRVEKTINGVTTMYLYDGLDIIMEMDEMGAPTASYIRTPSIDEPLARVELGSGAVRYYLANPLGSVTALTDENGVVKTTYNYDPFGQVAASGEASSNPFQFAGREHDVGTDLLFERNRYYSFDLQRYISEDPIGMAGGDVNYYVRVVNNPVNFVDPLGLTKKDPWYGYNNRDFRRWFHRCWKQKGDPPVASKDDIEEAYAEWVRRGSPKDGKCWGEEKENEKECERSFWEKAKDAWNNFNEWMQEHYPQPSKRPGPAIPPGPFPVPMPLPIP